MTATTVPEALLQKIRQGNRFILSTHSSPDGDAIGSELGLARILRKLGKGATVWNLDETPKIYEQLPGSDRIHTGEDKPGGFPEMFDAVILLECPSPDRSGLEESLATLPLINIDHHLGNEHYGEVNWIDTAAPAVGEMVYRLARGLKIELDRETATALFLTLVTDTGGFRFANATPPAFEAAAALIAEGAHPEQVSEWLYESRPVGMMKLLGEMLQTLELHHENRIATVHLTPEMFLRAGASQSDTEGLIDYPRTIAGVEAVALIRQLDGDRFKVSLRSRGDVDVEKLAREHGGGGHRNAAGLQLSGTGDTVQRQVVSALIEELDQS